MSKPITAEPLGENPGPQCFLNHPQWFWCAAGVETQGSVDCLSLELISA